MSGSELDLIRDAFASNWIAPLGPFVDEFERRFADAVGAPYAVATSSGSAALHLALELVGVAPGDEVLVSTLTFAASAFPVRYQSARPTFIDSEAVSWNLSPDLLDETLRSRAAAGRLPAAVVAVHLYGQTADLNPIVATCRAHGVPLIEDAAEALGATYAGRPPGTFGDVGVFSFNGNKMITTSGGGMLVTRTAEMARRARKLATQAREPAPHYEHAEVGYNYRLSNLLAAVGVAQLGVLAERVTARRAICAAYTERLRDVPGVCVQPEAPWGTHARWLTTVLVDPAACGADCHGVRLALERHNIEARPLWKPMHQQPVFASCDTVGGAVADDLFAKGLCLPSGSALTGAEIDRVVDVIRRACARR
jgi:pyridoxal phosphate-dependent aminotransferase EpsN